MPTTKLDEIPTLTQLYDEGFWDEHVTDDSEAASSPKVHASAALNDKVCLIRADITTLEVDAIVNAANQSLLGGGGVDGRIHSVCGPELVEECRGLKGCSTGDAKITLSYGTRIGCKHIIHTVGPIYHSQPPSTSASLLSSCYRRSLEVAVKNNLKSIAFCAVSTGIYGYPSLDAAKVAIKTVREFLEAQGQDADGEDLEKVVFCVFEAKDERAYTKILPSFFPRANSTDANTATSNAGSDDWVEVSKADAEEIKS